MNSLHNTKMSQNNEILNFSAFTSREGLVAISVLSFTSFLFGWFLGKQNKSSTKKSLKKQDQEKIEGVKNEENKDAKVNESDSDPDSETEGPDFEDIINSYTPMQAPFKMVLCVNTGLKKMEKGKMAAQCGHATLGAYKVAKKYCSTGVNCWEWTGQAKICVKVPSESELLDTQAKAQAAGLVTYLVLDAGHTQIPAGSKTVLALGPAPASSFQGISDHFKLM
mmetsp:Transcript_2860/g.4082  ORF Transcript_2860/g.4082 Transcript_2860/m.4082 type:complete len:223 (+) Transcript_2860:30-698(+)